MDSTDELTVAAIDLTVCPDGSFPNDNALLKLVYLALRNISQQWTMPMRYWKAALNRFTQFEDRTVSAWLKHVA